MNELNQIAKRIEESLSNTTYKSEPKGLYEPISYTLRLESKKLRPLLTASIFLMFKDNIREVFPLCNAVEIFHNFTLVHDDIMDQAPIRRGEPTVYKKWDVNTAILSGDVMLVHAYEQLSLLESSQFIDILKSFNEGAIKVCEGQQFDMNFETDQDVSVDSYLNMIYLKTAALLEHAVDMAAILAQVNEIDTTRLRSFAKNMGISFQLKDDLLDCFGDSNKVGKQKGGDILANKKTYLLLKARELASESQLKEINKWLNTSNQSGKKVSSMLQIFKDLNIESITQDLVKEYYMQGVVALKAVECEKPIKE